MQSIRSRVSTCQGGASSLATSSTRKGPTVESRVGRRLKVIPADVTEGPKKLRLSALLKRARQRCQRLVVEAWPRPNVARSRRGLPGRVLFRKGGICGIGAGAGEAYNKNSKDGRGPLHSRWRSCRFWVRMRIDQNRR